MKKTLSVLLALVMTALLFTPGVFAASKAGDIDSSGVVDAADARLALRMAVGLETYIPGGPRFKAADVDGDGKLTASDARIILRAAVGLETLPELEDGDEEPLTRLTSKEVYRKGCTFTFEITTVTAEYTAIGSGFAITADGEIVTNYHVIEDALSITVKDYDGKEYPVTGVVAFDRHIDLAVIRVEGTLTPAVLDYSDYETGDTVYTLGSSNGYTGTFANGVIANDHRMIEDYNPDVVYIQTSAPISGGNSGGPLIDEYGRVIGVNTLTDEQGQNLNFAIPVSYLEALDRSHPMTVDEFSKQEETRRGMTKLFGDNNVSMRVGGVASYIFYIDARGDATLTASCPSDKVSVRVSQTSDGYYTYGFVRVIALGETDDAAVTVSFKEDPSVSCVLHVTVTPDAPAEHPGMAGTPDLGALFGVAPSSFEYETALAEYPDLVYDGSALTAKAGSADNVRATYEAALTEAGFTLNEQTNDLLRTTFSYVYYNAKTGLSLLYLEHRVLGRLVDVTVSF